jgi:predicted permease
VAGQLALCLLLLICAGLFTRSLRHALNIKLGFEPEHVAAVSVNLSLQRYDEARALAFYEQLADRLAAVPGVQAVGWATDVPLEGASRIDSVALEGYQPTAGQTLDITTNAISPDYFRTLGIPLVAGRDFTAHDRLGAPGAAIINEALARAYWRGQNPIGKRIKDYGRDFFVVGVVQDHKFVALRTDPPPQIFFPMAQLMTEAGLASVQLVARTNAEPASLFNAIEREAHQLDPALPLFKFRSLDENIKDQLVAQRFGSTLLGLFSLLALTLAVGGIYGVVAYSVAQRTREIGIRMALGAQPRDILRLVLGRSSIPIVLGLALGLFAAMALTRLLTSFFYDLDAADPVTFGSAATLLAVVALLACYIPARRATKVDPLIALRYE